jgi:BASS family bile acid:Na+ symporter
MDNVSAIVLASALAIIMLGMGLSLVADDFKRIVVYPKAILVGLTNQIILLPLIGFLIAIAFPIKPEISIGIMILAACPGGPTSNLIAHLAIGDTALSVTLTSISSFITILTIPFIINFALKYFAEEGTIIRLNVPETILRIFLIIVVPVTIGMIIRKYKEGFAIKMGKPVRTASGIVLGLIIIGIVLKEKANFVSYFQQAGIVALLLNVSTMVVGYYSARLFRIVDKRALSISIESGIQNGTLAITIAVVLLHSTTYAIAPAVYSLIMFGTGGIFIYLGLRRAKSRGES